MHPGLIVIQLPGRALWFCDILSRQLDNVAVEHSDTAISKEQATMIPTLQAIKPGAVLSNQDLLDLFATYFGPELLDAANCDYKYCQKIDWSLYTNPTQFFTSEREFLIGSILGKLTPLLYKTSSRLKSTGQSSKQKFNNWLLFKAVMSN